MRVGVDQLHQRTISQCQIKGQDGSVIYKEGGLSMRTIVLAALTATAIGLIGAANTMAAPAQGSAIGTAAAATSPVAKVVVCAMRRVCTRGVCAMRRVCA